MRVINESLTENLKKIFKSRLDILDTVGTWLCSVLVKKRKKERPCFIFTLFSKGCDFL